MRNLSQCGDGSVFFNDKTSEVLDKKKSVELLSQVDGEEFNRVIHAANQRCNIIL